MAHTHVVVVANTPTPRKGAFLLLNMSELRSQRRLD